MNIQIKENDSGMKTTWTVQVPNCTGIHITTWGFGSGWSDTHDHQPIEVKVTTGVAMWRPLGEKEWLEVDEIW